MIVAIEADRERGRGAVCIGAWKGTGQGNDLGLGEETARRKCSALAGHVLTQHVGNETCTVYCALYSCVFDMLAGAIVVS